MIRSIYSKVKLRNDQNCQMIMIIISSSNIIRILIMKEKC
uniref:Uncharacterized protein n=1 Tax=Anguilla anguilla TaxID=7936 RepID=A0A0E9V8W4_ANGAN